MKQIITRQNIPLLLLISMSLLWSYYYLSNGWINDYGAAKQEWLLLIDGVIFLPMICLFCLKNDLKNAAMKAAVYACLMILLGSLIIPASEKHIWLILEDARYIILGLFVLFELVTIITVIVAIKAALGHQTDPDHCIQKPIIQAIGNNMVSSILIFEARVWAYALFATKISPEQFTGFKHFTGHLKDGTQSSLQGFLILIIAELPIVHLILHLFVSPVVAYTISALTIIGLVYFTAEYRAISRRPISLTADGIIIRYSTWNPVTVSYHAISSVSFNHDQIERGKGIKRYNLFGNPNVKIALNNKATGPLKGICTIYIGIDQAQDFIDHCQSQLYINT